jgi:hypothetical protein
MIGFINSALLSREDGVFVFGSYSYVWLNQKNMATELHLNHSTPQHSMATGLYLKMSAILW